MSIPLQARTFPKNYTDRVIIFAGIQVQNNIFVLNTGSGFYYSADQPTAQPLYDWAVAKEYFVRPNPPRNTPEDAMTTTKRPNNEEPQQGGSQSKQSKKQ